MSRCSLSERPKTMSWRRLMGLASLLTQLVRRGVSSGVDGLQDPVTRHTHLEWRRTSTGGCGPDVSARVPALMSVHGAVEVGRRRASGTDPGLEAESEIDESESALGARGVAATSRPPGSSCLMLPSLGPPIATFSRRWVHMNG